MRGSDDLQSCSQTQSTFRVASDSEENAKIEELISNIDLNMDEAW